MYGRRSRQTFCCFVCLIRYVDKMRGLATIIGGKEEDLRTQMMTAGMALAGEFAGAVVTVTAAGSHTHARQVPRPRAQEQEGKKRYESGSNTNGTTRENQREGTNKQAGRERQATAKTKKKGQEKQGDNPMYSLDRNPIRSRRSPRVLDPAQTSTASRTDECTHQ